MKTITNITDALATQPATLLALADSLTDARNAFSDDPELSALMAALANLGNRALNNARSVADTCGSVDEYAYRVIGD